MVRGHCTANIRIEKRLISTAALEAKDRLEPAGDERRMNRYCVTFERSYVAASLEAPGNTRLSDLDIVI